MLSQVCPHRVLDVMKCSTPLVDDVIYIIGGYWVTLYAFKRKSETSLKQLYKQKQNIYEFVDDTLLKGDFKNKQLQDIVIDYWHEGINPIQTVLCHLTNGLFLYRVQTMEVVSERTTCWLLCTRLEPLLSRMTKEHYIAFVLYQRTCQLETEL